MRLFSEEVTPTFTNSNLNIITVKDFYEVFFDVYELEINGKKYIAEKVAEYKGSPVISTSIIIDNKEYTGNFVLNRGKFEILVNKESLTYQQTVDDDFTDLLSENYKTDEVDELILEKRDTIIEDIQNAKLSAKKYINKLKQQQIQETTKIHQEKLNEFNAELKEIQQGLVEEFVRVVSNVRSDISLANDNTSDKLKKFITGKVSILAESLENNLENKVEDLEEFINETVNTIASNVISGVIATEIKSCNNRLDENIDGLFNHINLKLTELVKEHEVLTSEKVNSILSSVDDKLVAIDQVSIELNNSIQKSSNKALSRIGNVKIKLEEDIAKNVTALQHDIDKASERIKVYYDAELNKLNEAVNTLSDETKQECVKLISESRDSLLQVISEIKTDVPNIIIEKKDGTGKEIDLKKVKSELEKSITTRFSTELMSLKRMMEMMSGGGSVAQQFADGGTMNGNLTVVGAISASQYLGIPGGGGGVSGDYLPLSGGALTGNLTVQGTISSSGPITADSTVTVWRGGGQVISNTAVGYQSLCSNSIGGNNVANGYQALYFNTTGDNNVATGTIALYNNSIGSYNVATGREALYNNSIGSYNVAIGDNALGGTTLGDYNTAIGSSAGQAVSGGAYNDVSNNSIYLGADTKALSSGQTNQIVIGYDATGIGSNTATLGNDSIITTALKGKVGIGTTTPSARLSIVDTTLAGGAGLSGSALSVDQTWNTNLTPTALSVNVTDLSSNASSLLMDLRVEGVSRFRVRKDGIVVVGNYASFSGDASGKLIIRPSSGSGFANCAAQGFHANSNGIIGFTPTSPDGTPDTVLVRDAANTLAQRNGLNAQTSRIYNTYTSTTNNQRSTFTWANSAFVIGTETNSSLPLSAQPSAAPIIIAPGYNSSLSATAPVVFPQTWNNAANTFTLLSANVTDTASSASSLLMDLQVGGVSRASVRKDGRVFLGSNGIDAIWTVGGRLQFTAGGTGPFLGVGANSVIISNSSALSFSDSANAGDTVLIRDAANTLAQRNGLNPQEFRLYNKFNNASDYERFFIKTNVGATSATQIGLSAAGSGVNRNLEFVVGGSTRMTIASSGNITASGTVGTGGYTLAALLALPNPATIGMRTYITDGQESPVFMANAASGGSTVTPVFYNGSAWINC